MRKKQPHTKARKVVALLPIAWMGNSRREIAELPEWARQRLGKGLENVQYGGEPDSWKSMPRIGAGCREIRAREGNNVARCLYFTTPRYVVVLIAFVKKDEKTPPPIISIAKKRYTAAKQRKELL